ncbi:TPA: hypothetical protein ACIFEE_000468 [Acinetobacter baumannii]
MATALTSQYTRFTDKCNRVLAGGVVKTFEPNSLIPKITYQDPLATIPNLPEVVLDSTGRARIYLLGDYRVQIYSNDGTLIEDNLYVDQGVSQTEFLEVNKTLIANVDSLEDLEEISNVWDGRTIYVKDLGNYRYDALTTSWVKAYQDADNVIDGEQTQKEINFAQKQLNIALDSDLNYLNYGLAPAERLKVYVQRLPIQMILKNDGSDETETVKGYFAAADALGKSLRIPEGICIVSDTITISSLMIVEGIGRDTSILQFRNETLKKPLFKFVRGGGLCDFYNFTVRPEIANVGVGWEFNDSTNDVGSPLWKCSFRNIVTTGFYIGDLYTSSNPLNGSTHAHCSEMLWLNCRFINNKIGTLVQNRQAVNNMYLHTDRENFNASYINGQNIVDNNFEHYRDEAGGGITHLGGSIIGRGKLYSWLYPSDGTSLWTGAYFTCDKVKAELRSGHNGVVINEEPGSTSSISLQLRLADIDFTMNSQDLDLLRFGGRVNADFRDLNTVSGTGKLTIREYPTLGRSANTNTGSQGSIDVYRCGRVYYEKETTSPYGTYNADYTARVSFHDQCTSSTNQSFSIDADGWMSLNNGGDIQQLGFRFGSASPFGKLVVNSDANGLPLDWKIYMPKYGRPFKLFLFKHPSTFASNMGYELYLAKNKASWADPANFNYVTDAFLVAAIPDTTNKAGYFEVNIQLTNNSLGAFLQSGMGSWTEGRMFLRKIGASNMVGFVGVEYA